MQICVSTFTAYMLPTSTDDIYVPNVNSCIKSSHSTFTVPSIPPVCLTTVHNNVIKKPITCRDFIIKHPRKYPRKSTIIKNLNAVNYVSEPVNNVVNCICSFSTSSSIFVCQPVHFNRFVHKHISSSVANKPTPSVDYSETFCTIVKCKNKFYDVWIQFLILFSVVTMVTSHLI